jgi:hypothetical protein
MTKIVAIVTAAGVLGMVSSAFAAPRDHRPASTHWSAGHHRSPRVQPRVLEPRYVPAPYAYGFQPPGFGMPYSSAEERWFDQAKGNIW